MLEPLGYRTQRLHNHIIRDPPNYNLRNMGVSDNLGTLFWGPYNKDPTI